MTQSKHAVSLARALLIAAIAALSAACSHQIPLNPTKAPPAAVSAKVPATVGVYYSPAFRDHIHSGKFGGDTWNFPLGNASVLLCEQSLPSLFTKTVPLTQRQPLPAGTPALDAVLEPRIEGFTFGLPMLKTGLYTAEIVYRFVLLAPDGTEIGSWTTAGSAAKPGEFGFEFARWPGEAADVAMRQAMDRFLQGFDQVPEVRRWLRERNAGTPTS